MPAIRQPLRVSLVANAALAVICIGLYLATRVEPEAETADRSGERTPLAETEGADQARDEPTKPDASGVPLTPAERRNGTPSQIAALLEERGWSRDDARAFAAGMLSEDWLAPYLREPRTEYWLHQTNELSLERQRAWLEATREMSRLFEEIIPGRPLEDQWDVPFSREKRNAVRLLETDYRMLRENVEQEADGFLFPEDRELLDLLETNRLRELREILTPAEIEEYKIRYSEHASRLRRELGPFEPSEEEFREIYLRESEIEREFGTLSSRDLPSGQRRELDRALMEMRRELSDSLGEERYAEYRRSRSQEYRWLVQISERYDVPRQSVDETDSMLSDVTLRAMRLRRDETIEPDERAMLLEDLVEETRSQVRELLGDGGFEAFERYNLRLNSLEARR